MAAFQSTHPRGVRRGRGTQSHIRGSVSIHAPTRGATESAAPGNTIIGVSIHAPTRGATARPPRRGRSRPCFNPRTHAGCDRLTTALSTCARRFQSTHPRGVRRIIGFVNIYKGLFQSTHPRGVRPLPPALRRSAECFNPRTHAGCDRCWASL